LQSIKLKSLNFHDQI